MVTLSAVNVNFPWNVDVSVVCAESIIALVLEFAFVFLDKRIVYNNSKDVYVYFVYR